MGHGPASPGDPPEAGHASTVPLVERAGRVAASVPEIVRAIERRLCGGAAVESTAAARALAAIGRTAAVLPGSSLEGVDGTHGAWVAHVASEAATGIVFPYELVAADAQTAVDHCAVAHLLASVTRRPVLCRIPASIAEEPAVVRSLDTDAARRLLARSAQRADVPTAETIRWVFEEVARMTGRALLPTAAAGRADADVVRITTTPTDGSLARADASRPASGVKLAVAPGGPWSESVLLETALLLGDRRALSRAGSTLAVARLAIAASGEDPPRGPADLLLLARSDDAPGPDLGTEIVAGGTVLLVQWPAGGGHRTVVLTDAQRRIVRERGLRVLRVELQDVLDDRPFDSDHSRLLLAGALLGVSESRGSEGGPIRRVDPPGLEHRVVATLDRGRAAVGEDGSGAPLDRSRSCAEGPFRPTGPERADPAWARAVREFHLYGRGACSAVDPTGVGGLRPLLLPPAAESGTEPIELCLRAVRDVQREGRRRLGEEIEGLAGKLDELLQSQAPPGAGGVDAMAATLGSGADLVDVAALTRNLPPSKGPRRDASRRARIARTIDALRAGASRLVAATSVLVVQAPGVGAAGSGSEGARHMEHDDPGGVACSLHDALAAEWVELFRALRVGRLEAAGQYDAARHGWRLERLDASSLRREELLALPRVVVVERASRLRGCVPAGLGELVRCGRPLVTLVLDDRMGPTLSGHEAVGLVAATGQRGFVLQTTAARPDHLRASLGRAATSAHPVLAWIAAWTRDPCSGARSRQVAALEARATPCFVFDPSQGTVGLEGNPAPGQDWPVGEVPYREADGRAAMLQEPFTHLHASALDPGKREHFRVLPPAAWSDEQQELGAFLEADERGRRGRIPFFWVVREDGEMARAVPTRRIVVECLDRLRGWRMLEGLALAAPRPVAEVARSFPAEPTASAPRGAEPDRAALDREIHRQAANAAVERLARALLAWTEDSSAPGQGGDGAPDPPGAPP